MASLCVVAAGPRASAEPTWLPMVEVSPGSGQPERYDVDHLPDDTIAVVWSGRTEGDFGRVTFTTRAPGQAGFSPGAELSEPGAIDPQLVVDDRGAITVAWLTSANTVQATRLEPGNAQWTTPETVTRAGAQEFELVVASNGAVTVVSRHEVYYPDADRSATAWTPARSRQVSPGRWSHRSSSPKPWRTSTDWKP